MMVGTISASSAFGQITDITSFVVSGDNVKVDRSASAITSHFGGADDVAYEIDSEGVIDTKDLFFVSDDPDFTYSKAKAASGKFSSHWAFRSMAEGNSTIISYGDENIQGLRTASVLFLDTLSSNSALIVVQITEDSFIGDGTYGDEGVSMVHHHPDGGSSQLFIAKIDSEGNISDSVLVYDESGIGFQTGSVSLTSDGDYLIKIKSIFEMYKYVYIPMDDLTNDDGSPNITKETSWYSEEILMVEGTDGTFYLNIDDPGSHDEIVRLDVIFNPAIASDKDYTYLGPSSASSVFVGENFVSVTTGTGMTLYGSDQLDMRYSISLYGLVTGPINVISVDFSSKTARAFVTYEGAEMIAETELEVAGPGETGIAFFTIDFSGSGQKIMVSDAADEIIAAFNYMERSEVDTYEMIPSDNYHSTLVFASADTYEDNLGLAVPTEWYEDLGLGWSILSSIIELDAEGYYFVLGGGALDYSEGTYVRVNLTTDPLYEAEVNVAPTCSASNWNLFVEEVILETVSIFDGNGDTLDVEVIGLPLGISYTYEINPGDPNETVVTFTGEVDRVDLGFYNITVVADDGEEVTEESFTADFSLNTVGLPEENQTIFSIYPNPTVDEINVNAGFEHAEIYTITGNKLMSFTKKEVDVTGLTPGTYLLIIYPIDGNPSTLKFVKE